jgi:hypothetical protein
MMQGAKLAVDIAAPIGDDLSGLDLVGDAEEQVDVGPAILSAVRRGAGHRGSRDPRVLFGEPEQLASHRSSMITGEHSPECRPVAM